jgi:hypothetical protein
MTDYDDGIRQGKRQEREAILEYIQYHPQATAEDITAEIEGRYKFDQRMKLGGIEWNSMNWKQG